MFEKPDKKLLTYHQPSVNLGPPYKRGPYETLDYVVATDRWKNAIQDVESDVEANVASDHYPLWWTACIKFRRKAKSEDMINKRIKLKPCSEELKLK